ncbi:MAG TPA: glycosyltransferase [Fimbriimonadaceae bacterium]|nr:glycosyltransferase [Fimbriimonadaceae bacterium]
MRICHLSTVHHALDVRIFEKECRSLAAAGYEVFLVANHTRDEFRDGVHIVALQRPKGRLKRIFVQPLVAMRKALATGASVIHFHDPELIPAGMIFRLLGKRVIYDAHENLPQDILHSKDYLPKLIRVPLSFLAKLTETVSSRCFTNVITVSDAFVCRFPNHKTSVVRNYPIIARPLMPTAELGNKHVVFTGGLSRSRCAREMVQAMEHLPEYTLTVAGPCRSGVLKAELEALPGWQRVNYVGMLDRDGVNQLMARASAGLLLNYPREDYVEISSNKLYEYMIAGLPVVASMVKSWEASINAVQNGVIVDGTNPEFIATGIREVTENQDRAKEMAARGREAALTTYSWDSEEKTLLAVYSALRR